MQHETYFINQSWNEHTQNLQYSTLLCFIVSCYILHIFELFRKFLNKTSTKAQKFQSRDKIPKSESTAFFAQASFVFITSQTYQK